MNCPRQYCKPATMMTNVSVDDIMMMSWMRAAKLAAVVIHHQDAIVSLR